METDYSVHGMIASALLDQPGISPQAPYSTPFVLHIIFLKTHLMMKQIAQHFDTRGFRFSFD